MNSATFRPDTSSYCVYVTARAAGVWFQHRQDALAYFAEHGAPNTGEVWEHDAASLGMWGTARIIARGGAAIEREGSAE